MLEHSQEVEILVTSKSTVKKRKCASNPQNPPKSNQKSSTYQLCQLSSAKKKLKASSTMVVFYSNPLPLQNPNLQIPFNFSCLISVQHDGFEQRAGRSFGQQRELWSPRPPRRLPHQRWAAQLTLQDTGGHAGGGAGTVNTSLKARECTQKTAR